MSEELITHVEVTFPDPIIDVVEVSAANTLIDVIELSAPDATIETVDVGTAAVSSGGGGTPGGSDTQIQFNDSDAFGGDDALTFDKTTGVLTLISPQTTGGITIRSEDQDSTGSALLEFQSNNGGDILSSAILITVGNDEGHWWLNPISVDFQPRVGSGQTNVSAGAGIDLNVFPIATNGGTIDDLTGLSIRNITASTGLGGSIDTINGIRIGAIAGATNNVALNIAAQGSGAGDYAIKVEGGKSQFDGAVIMPGLPIDDPLVVGQLWNNSGILTVSAGPP